MPLWANLLPRRYQADLPMSLTTASENCPETPAAVIDLPCQNCDTGRVLSARGYCCRDFRSALGRFATGVTVITAKAADGSPIGVTISSFNSVSLDPPLVLWSLSLNSPNLAAFRDASHYAVNVLAAGQQDLSDRFASRRGDRFVGVSTHTGAAGVALLDGCSAWFECSNEAHYPGGDHLIFVGHVEHFAQGEKQEPLVFHDGRYRRLNSAAAGD